MAKIHSSVILNILAGSLLIVMLSSQTYMLAKAQGLCLSQFALANQACSFLRPKGPDEIGPDVTDKPDIVTMRNRRHHKHHHDPKDSACCRRLSSVDNACVCEAMVRLPLFITKPKHIVTITPVDGCDVSFECDGI